MGTERASDARQTAAGGAFFGSIKNNKEEQTKHSEVRKRLSPPACVRACACATWAISCRYGPKCSLVTLGRQNDGITSVSAKSSPHVLVKKSDSRLASRGSFSAAGRLTLELNTVHLSCSATTEGPSHRARPSPAEQVWWFRKQFERRSIPTRERKKDLLFSWYHIGIDYCDCCDGIARTLAVAAWREGRGALAPTCGLLGTDVGQRPDGPAAGRGEILLLVKNPASASVRPRRGAVAGGHGIGTGLPGRLAARQRDRGRVRERWRESTEARHKTRPSGRTPPF